MSISNIISVILASVLGFIFGVFNFKYVSNKDITKVRLEKIYAPIIKEFVTFGIEYNNITMMIDRFYMILCTHFQYFPEELSKPIILLKDKCKMDENITNLDIVNSDDFKKLLFEAQSGYNKCQEILRYNWTLNKNKLLYSYLNFYYPISKLNYYLNLIFMFALIANISFDFIDFKYITNSIFLNSALFFSYLGALKYKRWKESRELKLKLKFLQK